MPAIHILLLAPTLVACTSQNVAPLSEFGPMSASIDVELGPVSAEHANTYRPFAGDGIAPDPIAGEQPRSG